MIAIEFEHLKLQPVTEDDLELMRIWRNSPHVSEQMEYNKMITEEDHLKWFQSLDKNYHLYLKIISGGLPVGILNLKDINWEKGEGEAGVFIGREDFLGTVTPVLSVYIFMKALFDCFSFNNLFAKIAKANTNALLFNKKLGYVFYKNLNEGFDYFVCTKEEFNRAESNLSGLFKQNDPITVFINEQSSFSPTHENTNRVFKFIYL